MKVLHVNCSDCGSTGKIIDCINKELVGRKNSAVLVVPKQKVTNDYLESKYVVSTARWQSFNRKISQFGILQYGFAPISTRKIKKIIKKENPDVVHLHSINRNMVNIFSLLSFLKQEKIPTVVTNHAEFFYTGSCAYAFDCEQWENGCKHCPTLRSATNSVFLDVSHRAWKKNV